MKYLLLAALLLTGCTTVDTRPKAIGYALGITFLETESSLTADQVQSCRVVYKVLDKMVGENPSPSIGLTAAVATAAGMTGSAKVASLTEKALNDLYGRLKDRYGFAESDRETQLRILRNLRNGIRQALEDEGK